LSDSKTIFAKKIVFNPVDKTDQREILIFDDQIRQLKNEYPVKLTENNIKEVYDK
jgi:hypothetical protein